MEDPFIQCVKTGQVVNAEKAFTAFSNGMKNMEEEVCEENSNSKYPYIHLMPS